MPTENEMLEQLREGKVSLPPLLIRPMKYNLEAGNNSRPDALVEIRWDRNKAGFIVECRSLSTPKAFRDGLNRLKASSLPKGYSPLLFVPFLSEQQLMELEKEGISGMDLCGNGIVIAKGSFLVFRSGGKNRFTSSAPIKNVYRKNSSMVGRVFLARPSYPTVRDVLGEINQRNPMVKDWKKKPMSFATVSKALKTLEEDLIIDRENTIRLLQPEKLLQKLTENRVPPNIKTKVRLKVSEKNETLTELLKKASENLGLPLMCTGTSSVERYAVMQRGDLLSVYCPRLDTLLEKVKGSATDRFPNLELLETGDETIYFDRRYDGEFWWASPVQVYLELMAGDKRDQETAEQVKTFILDRLEKVLP